MGHLWGVQGMGHKEVSWEGKFVPFPSMPSVKQGVLLMVLGTDTMLLHCSCSILLPRSPTTSAWS